MTRVHGSCSLQVMGSWLSLLRLEHKQKCSSNPFQMCIFLFLSYLFGIETINTFIPPVVPSKTIPDSRQKWAKCIPIFRPKQCKNPTRLYKGVLPPPFRVESKLPFLDFGFFSYFKSIIQKSVEHRFSSGCVPSF